MAKKNARKKTADGPNSQPPKPAFDQLFPTIARWVSQEEGWVELGADHHSRSVARALYGGGMAWEGTDDYGSLDEALRAMEKGIGAWIEENRPDKGRGGRARKKPSPAQSVHPSIVQRKSSPKATRPERNDRVKGDTTSPVPRAVVEKVRKFADIAEGLRRGQRFEITRLTTIKGLCEEPRAAPAFALFLARQARMKAEEKKAPGRVKELTARATNELESYLDDPSKEQRESLYSLLREMEQEQNEFKRISWGQVRIVHSMELLVVEKSLKSVLRDNEAPTWLYQAARDYAERYDPRHGTGLIPGSAPMVQEIADFWREFYGIEG